MLNQELYRWGRITLIMLVVFLGVLTVSKVKDLGAVVPAANAITVTGMGEASAVPNIATFSFSVSADAAQVADAQGAVEKKIGPIIAKLKGMGIADADIQTSGYNVYPKYTYQPQVCTQQYPNICPPGRQVQDGYTASESVTVKVRQTDQAGAALAAVGGLGATNISGLSFTTEEPQKIADQARAKAITDAKSRAQALAKELGVHVVRVVSYSDSNSGQPVPIAYMAAGSSDKASIPTIQPGENKVTITVQVTYEIR